MTRNEILQVTHVNFSEFQRIYLERKRDQGLGALVFMSEEGSGTEDEVQCEYWTLSELRHYLRSMEQCDEVFYKWLTNVEGEGAYPIVIFSPNSELGCEQLHFACVRKAGVS